MTAIRFRRGNKANLPASAPSGTPLWCEDTKELYIGTDASVYLINNFANLNADTVDGCHAGNAANNVLKLDTSGKVPTSNLPALDSIPTGSVLWLSGSTAPTGYMKCNGASISKSTYSSLYSAVGDVFTNISQIPDLKSNSDQGYTITPSTGSTDSWRIFDKTLALQNASYPRWQATALTGNLILVMPKSIKMNKYTMMVWSDDSCATRYAKSWNLYVSSNGGTNWTLVDAQTNQTTSSTTRGTVLSYNIPITQAINAIKLEVTANCGDTSYMSVGRMEFFGNDATATTFNIPDLRGVFIRGWDDSRGIDTGRIFGSFQADEIKAHYHVNPMYAMNDNNGGNAYPAGGDDKSSGPYTSQYSNSSSVGGTETRPKNLTLLPCIKY